MHNIVSILRMARPLYGLMAITAGFIVLVAASQLAMPVFSKFIVDEIVKQVSENRGNLQLLITLVAGAFGASLLSITFTAISERFGDKLSGELKRFLTERFYEKVLSLPQSYFDSQISGKIVHQLNRGIQTIIDFLSAASNFILPNILQIIITVAILMYFSLPVGLFMLLLFPIYTALSSYSSKRWGVHEVKKNHIEDTTRGRMNEVIQNIKLVKGFLTEPREYQFVSGQLVESNKIYDVQSSDFHRFDFFRNLSLQVILLLVNIVVFYNTFQGVFTIGEMVLIIQLVTMAQAPLFAMSFILERMQMAEQGSKEYFEIMELSSTEPLEAKQPTADSQNRLDHPSITFDQVSFHYEESEDVLKDVSFSLNPRETVALVGHSGAGKTTIVNLIMKLYDYTGGDMLLNQTSYRDLSHAQVRSNIALVFQDNELFSTTIRENVAYGFDQVSDDQVQQALERANAWEFVAKLPDGINAQIGERGVRLSGGQKQRIQIARAILKDAPILILDEATSSLDAKSEKLVQEALEQLFTKRMVLIIAHRFSTLQNADKIIVLDNGTVVDYGKPGELARKDGIYSDLLRYQVEGNEKLLKQYELF